MDEDEIIKAVKDWSPWLDNGGKTPEKYTGEKRNIDLEEYLDMRAIKLITGIRRCGKSTLVYQATKKLLEQGINPNEMLFVNFSEEELKKFSLEDICEVYEKNNNIKVNYLFVDEVQDCKKWTSFIRRKYDLKQMDQIWITSSNSSYIKREYATLFTGRNTPITVSPLSFKEFISFKRGNKEDEKEIINFFNQYILEGGFPEITFLKNLEKKETILKNYYRDILEKDIQKRDKLNLDTAQKVGKYLCSNYSKFLNPSKFARRMKINESQILEYLDIFKEVFLFKDLVKFDYSLSKQSQSQRKIYGVDTGLLRANVVEFSENRGRKLENIVHNELKRRNEEEIYYHTGDNVECDFITQKGYKIQNAIQVTQSLEDKKVRHREILGLVKAMETYDLKKGLILTEDQSSECFEHGKYLIEVKPITKWLLEAA
jgi:predicted AAA+ superfamily ATPase